MKQDHQNDGYWTGWIVAYGIAAVLFLFAIWQGALSKSLCTPDEAHCFRDWLSASGGWAALIAAVPTVLFLSRQISDADRHHKHQMIVALRTSRTEAKFVKLLAEHLQDYAARQERYWNKLSQRSEPEKVSVVDVKMVTDHILKTIREPRVTAFLGQYGEPDLMRQPIDMAFDLMETLLNSIAEQAEDGRHLAQSIVLFLQACSKYGEHMHSVAQNHLNETDSIIG